MREVFDVNVFDVNVFAVVALIDAVSAAAGALRRGTVTPSSAMPSGDAVRHLRHDSDAPTGPGFSERASSIVDTPMMTTTGASPSTPQRPSSHRTTETSPVVVVPRDAQQEP
ncbi:MAG: hypothetical protein ACSLE6_20405 [Mycobacterium sp.]